MSQQPSSRLSRWLADVRVQRAVVLLVLLIAPLTVLSRKALFDPQTKFLPPSPGAGWVLYSAQEEGVFWPFYDKATNGPKAGFTQEQRWKLTADALFERRFALDQVPSQMRLTFRAFKHWQVEVNGEAVAVEKDPANWKLPQTVDIAPQLQVGENVLRIQVGHWRAFPALQVLSPALLQTPAGWRVARETDHFATFEEVVGPLYRKPAPGPLQRLEIAGVAVWPIAKWSLAVWLALLWAVVLWVAWSVMTRRGRRAERQAPRGASFPKWLRIAVPTLIFVVAGAVNLYNALHVRFFMGADNPGHIEHVHTVAREWRIPDPAEGWQTYQPPAYYWSAAAVYHLAGGSTQKLEPTGDLQLFDDSGLLRWHYDSAAEAGLTAEQFEPVNKQQQGFRAVVVFSTAVGFGLTIIAYLFARRLLPDDPVGQWVVLGFAGLVPVQLVMNALVNGEAFTATMIGLLLYLALRFGFREQIRWWQAVLIGAAAGTAMLSKFTALAGVAAVLFVLGMRFFSCGGRLRWVAATAAVGVVMLAVCGWFYYGNMTNDKYIPDGASFATPFIGNWHPKTNMLVHQMPTYRAASYFFSFGDVFFNAQREAMFRSWWDANFAGLWGQGEIYTRPWADARNVLSQVMILLGALPVLAMLLGFLRATQSVWRKPAPNPDLLLVAATLLMFYSLWLAAMKHPVAGVGTPRYFLGIMPLLAVFLAYGRDVLRRHAGWMRVLLDVHLVVLAALAVLLCRFDAFLY